MTRKEISEVTRKEISKVTRHIWAVGRNYVDHAKEMNADLPNSPLFFLKAGGCLVDSSKITIPSWSNNIHHELEIALRVKEKNGALHFSEMALALDLTERDFQSEAKRKGQPWTLAKSFTGSCPVSSWISYDANTVYSFQLLVNGSLRQSGDTTKMIFSPAELLSFANTHFPIENGDILLTGTPAGVAQIHAGDHLDGRLIAAGKSEPVLTCHWNVN